MSLPPLEASRWTQLLNSIYAFNVTGPSAALFPPKSFVNFLPSSVAKTYDALYLAARAAHSLICDQGLDPTLARNRDAFMQAIRNTSFAGVSGNISLNENGDILQPMQIMQQRTLLPNISYTPTNVFASFQLSNGLVNRTWQMVQRAPFFFAGTFPLDTPLKGVHHTSRSTNLAFIVVPAVIMAGLAGLIVATFVLRTRMSFKSTSPLFTMLCLFGCLLMVSSVIPRAAVNELSNRAAPSVITKIRWLPICRGKWMRYLLVMRMYGSSIWDTPCSLVH